MLKKKLQSDLKSVNRKLSSILKVDKSKLTSEQRFIITIRTCNYYFKGLDIKSELEAL